MFLTEKVSVKFYEDLASEGIKMHKSLLFFRGNELNNISSSISKVAKNICAMANSGGGDIIYGIKVRQGRAEMLDPVVDFQKSEEWFFYELQAYIEAPIRDLKIFITDLGNNLKIIHFSIPVSNGQPHMFADNKYYKIQKNRPVVLTEPEVRELYGKLSICELEFLGIYNTNGLPIMSGGKYSSMNFYPKILIRNAGNIVEKNYKIELSFPARLHEESFQPLQSLFIRHEGTHVVFGQKGLYPLFQQEISTMIEAKITVNSENIDTFLKEDINILLYFSNGIKKHSLKMSDILTYNGKQLNKNDFVEKNYILEIKL